MNSPQPLKATTRHQSMDGDKGQEDAIASITEILTDIRHGKMVVLVDAEDRENEGDLVMAAEHITPAAINFMATHGRGLICLTLTEAHCKKLGLPLMVEDNRTPHRTAFTVSIEAAEGVTTGISAHDRAHTIVVASQESATPDDIVQPGHVFPLMARAGGVLSRAGHTEAGCDLSRLAGLRESSVICEILNEDGTMARLPDLIPFAKKHGLKIGTIASLIEYRMSTESLVKRIGHYPVHTPEGDFEMHFFQDHASHIIHTAFTHGATHQIGHESARFNAHQEVLVRVQHPFSTLDFIELKPRADAVNPTASVFSLPRVLRAIKQSPAGVVIGLRSPADEEHKMMALCENMAIQDRGSRAITKPKPHQPPQWDSRLYGTGAQILRALGVNKMRLLSHPINLANLKGFGLEIAGFETLSDTQKT